MNSHVARKRANSLSILATGISIEARPEVAERDNQSLLWSLATFEDDIEALRAQLCRDAHEEGASWQEIGDWLGISKQAAWHRYGR